MTLDELANRLRQNGVTMMYPPPLTHNHRTLKYRFLSVNGQKIGFYKVIGRGLCFKFAESKYFLMLKFLLGPEEANTCVTETQGEASSMYIFPKNEKK